MPEGPPKNFDFGPEGFKNRLGLGALLQVDGRWAQYIGGSATDISIIYLDSDEKKVERISLVDFEIEEFDISAEKVGEVSDHEVDIPADELDRATHSDPDHKERLEVRGVLKKRSVH